MVARSPPQQQRKMALLPPHLREAVDKVDKCVARLQELQHTVTGGPGVRGYFQSSLRIRNGHSRRSPTGKLPAVTAEDWRRMSLPAMLLGETMGEVLRATQFARTVAEAAAVSSNIDPITPPPVTLRRKPKANIDQSMRARRMMEKQVVPASNEPSLKRVKSRINFKVPSPPLQRSRECEKENCRYMANRVSPRNRPWERKAVLFPNPLFNSKMSSSPVFARNNPQTPHKFLIKSPPKIKSPTGVSLSKKKPSSPPKDYSSSSARIRRSFSPLKTRKVPVQTSEEMKGRQIASYKFLIKSSLVSASSPTRRSSLGKASSPPKASKLRRSFSPSRLANRIVMLSPFKTRSNSMKKPIISRGLDQQPISSSTRF